MNHTALAVAVLLCLAALAFPFSVAASNVTLGLALAVGILTGQWWHGVKCCWQDYRLLTLAFCIYFAWMIVGLAWSQDKAWGVHVLGRQWFWLLIPVIVTVLKDKKWRDYFLISWSVGLTLNLVYCLLQMYGYIVLVGVGGSGMNNATGHIGHIGFGVVYGLWGAWLLHLGWIGAGWKRWVPWGLASWVYSMVFMAQGKGGYLVATLLMLAVAIYYLRKASIVRWLLVIGLFAVIIAFGAILGSTQERWTSFWSGIHAMETVEEASISLDMRYSTQQRLYMIVVSMEVWKQSPFFGVGTGGLPAAVKQWQQQDGHVQRLLFVHPHNQYILDLVRWGPVGLLSLLLLLCVWSREGWKQNWNVSTTAPLIFLSALALGIHALFAPSLEEHFSAILAALLLGVGLAGRQKYEDSNRL